jgi:hypothetical protein
LFFVTTTLYVGQFAFVGLTAVTPFVHAAVVGAAPLDGIRNVGFASVVDDNAVVRPPVCVHA